MHVTQPTASMQLREVTQAVGVPLYEVIVARVYLTEAGQALARTARAICRGGMRLSKAFPAPRA